MPGTDGLAARLGNRQPPREGRPRRAEGRRAGDGGRSSTSTAQARFACEPQSAPAGRPAAASAIDASAAVLGMTSPSKPREASDDKTHVAEAPAAEPDRRMRRVRIDPEVRVVSIAGPAQTALASILRVARILPSRSGTWACSRPAPERWLARLRESGPQRAARLNDDEPIWFHPSSALHRSLSSRVPCRVPPFSSIWMKIPQSLRGRVESPSPLTGACCVAAFGCCRRACRPCARVDGDDTRNVDGWNGKRRVVRCRGFQNPVLERRRQAADLRSFRSPVRALVELAPYVHFLARIEQERKFGSLSRSLPIKRATTCDDHHSRLLSVREQMTDDHRRFAGRV